LLKVVKKNAEWNNILANKKPGRTYNTRKNIMYQDVLQYID